MQKFKNTRVGISEFSMFTRVVKKQAEAILNDLEKNKSKIPDLKPKDLLRDIETDQSKISKLRGTMIIPYDNCTEICYYGDKININLNIESLDKCHNCETCIIGVRITTFSPIALVIDDKTDIDGIMAEYNKNISSLSKSMPAFSEYTISEIDYSILFDLNELGHEFVTDELWDIVQRGIYSSYYSKKKYDSSPVTRLETNIKSNDSGSEWISVRHIRDYCENKNVPVNNAGKNSTNMILFMASLETKDSINTIMRELIKKHSEDEIYKNGNILLMKHLLSEERIKAVIREYFECTIMRGSYFKLPLAVEAVQNSDYNKEKKQEMITALKLISDSGDVHNARKHIVKNQMVFPCFNEALQNLVNIGVNPITIPDEFNIDHISGLLETCESLVYDSTQPVAKS